MLMRTGSMKWRGEEIRAPKLFEASLMALLKLLLYWLVAFRILFMA